MVSEEAVVKGITSLLILVDILFDNTPPKLDKKLPTEDCDSITFHFGEFRLICVDCMQTTLLLLRGTGKIEFTEALFGQAPDSYIHSFV